MSSFAAETAVKGFLRIVWSVVGDIEVLRGEKSHRRSSGLVSVFSVIDRFLRERKVRTKSRTSRETSTIVSAWAPAASAGTRARSCADPWAPPPCSRSAGRSRRRQGTSAPWNWARGWGWSPAMNALRRWSCACSRASPSSSPACYSTSSWSEGI